MLVVWVALQGCSSGTGQASGSVRGEFEGSEAIPEEPASGEEGSRAPDSEVGAGDESVDPLDTGEVGGPGSPGVGLPATFERTSLAGMIPGDAELVGVAITPSGERYVLDKKRGLYHLGESSAALVLRTDSLDADFGLAPGLELTDVTSMDDTRLLITAENDGFLFDLEAGTLESYFCYLPPPRSPAETLGEVVSLSQELAAEGVPVKQRTESVAFDADGGWIYAQPVTVDLERNAVRGSELFAFEESGGEPVNVIRISDPEFLAGGMVTLGIRVLLGRGDTIYTATDVSFSTGLPLDQGLQIAGMAWDKDGKLVLLDGLSASLVKIHDFPELTNPRLAEPPASR